MKPYAFKTYGCRNCFLINILHFKVILKNSNNLKTTNVSKNNNLIEQCFKNLAIIDFFTLAIGIASFFQPNWTILLRLFTAASVENFQDILAHFLSEKTKYHITLSCYHNEICQ